MKEPENPPYPGRPRYTGDWLDQMLGRPWGWNDPIAQKRYFEEHPEAREEALRQLYGNEKYDEIMQRADGEAE